MVKYPEDWEKIQLKDIGDVQMCRRVFQDQTKTSGEIPFYKISTFGGKADAFISRSLYEKYKALYHYPEKGDPLLSAAGTVGKTVIFDGKDSYFQDSNIVWLKVDEAKIDKQFLWWFYRSYPWKSLEGTTIQRLYNSIILDTEICLPQKEEQVEIANTLSLFDSYINDLTELIEKKRGIRDGAIEKLVHGDLSIDGHQIHYRSVTLQDVSDYKKETGHSPKRRYISTENMNQNFAGIVSYQENVDVKGCVFEQGNILMANIRPYLKKIWTASFNGTCSADVLVIQAKEDVCSKLLYYLLANDHFINYVMACGIKGIKMPRGDKKIIMQYPMLIPEKNADQVTIAEMLSSMDEEIENLTAEREKMIQIREGAMDDLLTGKVRLKA